MKQHFHFIACTNDPLRMAECRRYIERLSVPDGWQVSVTEITDARSMAEGYNRASGMHVGDDVRTQDVPVRIYLHQDVYVLNRFFLHNLLTVFSAHPDVMLLGMAGTPALDESGIMWAGSYLGNVYEPTDEPYAGEELGPGCTVTDAESVDGFLMVTRADVPWREDLFDGFDFYDVSESFEFARNGLRVAVADQKTPWCVHDDGRILSLTNYDHYRRIFLAHYKDGTDAALAAGKARDCADAQDRRVRIDILIGVAQKGGVENVINLTAPYLRDQGFAIRVVQLVWEGVQWVAEGIPFHPLLTGREGHTLGSMSDAYQDFLRSGEDGKNLPDLVLACNWPYMTYIAKNVAANLGLSYKVVSWLHNPVQRYIDAGYGGYDALRFADAHLAISEALAGDIRKNVALSTVYRISNPVDFSGVARDLPEAGEGPGCLYYIGRLSDVKRADLIVEALSSSHAPWYLTIIGDGEGDEKKKLETLIRERGLTGRVRLTGWRDDPWAEVKDDEVALVMASVYEGFPLVAIEAQARGIPVISTPVDGITELIRPGVNGYLFPFGDTQALAKIFDTMADGLFPEIDPAACKDAARPFEKETALADFTEKLREILHSEERTASPEQEMPHDKISVIIPCYNAAPFVGACLDSVLAQTYPASQIEIIVVNDASTDNTLEILRKYETEHPDRIALISYDENRGQGYARNTALSYASGNFISFVDSDDTIDPAMLSVLYEKARASCADFAICGYALMQGNDTVRTEEVPDAVYDLTDAQTKKRFILEFGTKNSPCTKLYRASFLREHDIFFPEQVKMEDVFFHELCMMHARRVISAGRLLYRYRLNENGTMFSAKLSQYYMDTFRVQAAAYARLCEEGLAGDFEDELAVIFYVKGFVEPMGHMLEQDYGIIYDEDNAALLKKTLLSTFPDILQNPYILQDTSDYNKRFLDLLR